MDKKKIRTLLNWAIIIGGIATICIALYIIFSSFFYGFKALHSDTNSTLGNLPSLMSVPAKDFVGGFMFFVAFLFSSGICFGIFINISVDKMLEVYKEWKAQKK